MKKLGAANYTKDQLYPPVARAMAEMITAYSRHYLTKKAAAKDSQ
jgi:hypothetical protein